MKLLEKVLLAIDFADHNNEDLIDAAMYLSDVFNSKIIAVNVIPGVNDDPTVLKYLEKFANDEMEKLGERFRAAHMRYSTRILRGNPFEQILETLEGGDFNVVLMGSGKIGKEESKPGVLVTKLIRKNSVPVWVMNSFPAGGFKNIICPVDFSDASKRALGNAVLLAIKMNARLKIVSVYEPLEIISGRITADLDEYNRKGMISYKKQFEDFLSEFDFSKVDHDIETLEGLPEKEILHKLETKEFDLLLMGTTGRSGLNRILVGSVTEKVIEQAPVSFITTKKKNILNPEYELKIAEMETLMKEAEKKFKEEDFNSAGKLYEKCLSNDPFFLPALGGAARAYRGAGKEQKAIRFEKYEKEIKERLWKSGREIFE